MFPEAEPRETFRFEGNKINCFPKDQSLSDLVYLPTKKKTNYKKFAQIFHKFAAVSRCTT